MSNTTSDNTTNPQQSKFDNEEVGAFWKRKAQNGGQTYLAGYLEGVGKVVVFTNKHKTADKHPDYRVYKSKPMNTSQSVENDVASNAPQEEAEELM